jgi:alkylation response protein AidB-like acyl-CoA dehydrogenase
MVCAATRRAAFCEETLDDVVVAGQDIIGQVNDGWSVTQTMLVYERRAGEAHSTPNRGS